MKTFKVLGSGCKKCSKTAEMIQAKADELGVKISLEKVTDVGDIMAYGVMSTPGVVMDEKVVHAGGLPDNGDIAEWIKA
ncbi:thioredoxin family protein [uncultured Cohaesibacter sp.]|uniref:thioredoxin family protein n=1 Tax=uncultured Cohaesibacter sp. TaxID=1002546 RepID=UPI00292DD73C|nr:thioredoxin family protein [uncultured Cohaesibacter sp.]